MKTLYTLLFFFITANAYTQDQPVENVVAVKTDSLIKPLPDTSKKARVFNPKVAARRSALIPGWGQVYNKKYWKVPIVYTALGITGYIFFDNIKNIQGI